MTLEQFRKNLFERFVAAFSESVNLPGKRSEATKMVYADGHRYDLEKYDNNTIPAGGDLLTDPPANNPYCYGTDTHGRPVYSRSEHTWNKTYWEGFYNYNDSVAEYVEFLSKVDKPIQLARLLFENNRKIGVQFLKLNAVNPATAFENLADEEIVAKFINNELDIHSRIELFHYENDRISYADCWSSYSGIGPQYYREIYTYNDKGALDEIKAVYEDGTSQYKFVNYPGLSLEALSELLTKQMAQAITDSFSLYRFDSPLAIVTIGYQEIGNYYPYITVVTATKQAEILEQSSDEDLLADLFITPETEYVAVPDDSFSRLYTAFINQVEDTNNYASATAMIRKVANLLTTNKLDGKVPVTPDFIAFAVDWSMAPEDAELTEIMIECGMPAETLSKWQQRGLFLDESQD